MEEFHGEMLGKKSFKGKSIDLMENHKISWRNAGDIFPAFLQESLQLIMEKNEK